MRFARGVTYALAVGLAALAIREAVAPRAGALGYGVPVPEAEQPTPYLEVKANRDLVLGAIMALIASSNDARMLRRALVVAAFAPLADAWTVVRHGKPAATMIHLATAALMIAGAASTREERG